MKMKYIVAGAILISFLGLFSCEKKEEKAQESVKEEKIQQVAENKMEQKQASVSEAYTLADKKGCFACHDVNRKKVGPAYKEVAKKYAGKDGAVDQLVKSITKGSMGKWGSIPMTPQPVTQEEAKKIAEWILSLK